MYFSLKIKVPKIIANLIIFLLVKYRKRKYGYGFMRIKLITNKNVDIKFQYAIVSPEDYQDLSEYPWQLWETNSNVYYAVRCCGRKIVYMHRQIMNAPPGKIVDHKDRNGLNNTRQNLRLATRSQNSCNRKRTKAGSSKYRGVYYVKGYGKWTAQIRYNGIVKYLGCFDNEEEAARAYDEAAKIYHGEFAMLNFNEDSHEGTKAQGKDVRR